MCIPFSDACKILNLIYFPHFEDANITCSVVVLLLPVVSPALVDLLVSSTSHMQTNLTEEGDVSWGAGEIFNVWYEQIVHHYSLWLVDVQAFCVQKAVAECVVISLLSWMCLALELNKRTNNSAAGLLRSYTAGRNAVKSGAFFFVCFWTVCVHVVHHKKTKQKK